MNIKYATLLLLLVSIPLFSQEVAEDKGISIVEKKLSYLDSIKKTFVNDDLAACVDSLWIKELTDLDLYNDITNDIENLNIDEKVDYELSTELLQSRLAEMNAKSPFRIEYNQSLENVIKSFLKYRKKSFGRLMAISEYYFPLFEEEFAKNNVPLEMKYLDVVESALNPKAVSKMGATGLWQFMYHTGKQYNLTIDSYVDERSDPLKSTAAASQYMTNMHAIFGDWELVLAAYNSGPGNVSKAIRRSGGKQNYWNIRKNLPKETQGYVPAFLATMYLYNYRKEHGIVPDRAELPHFATDTIRIKREISFKQISDLLDVPVSQLQLLNPSYKLNLVPFYKDKNHYLRLPLDKIAVFTSNEDKIYAYAQYQLEQRESPFQSSSAIASQTVSQTRTKYYKVRRGDNLGAIANKYDVSVTDLKKWNGIKGNTIAAGKSLKIISTENRVKTVKNEPKIEIAATQVKNTKTTKITKEVSKDSLAATASFYIVQKGDNLHAIAKNNNVTVAQIKEWNHLSGDAIQLGTSLRLNAIANEVEEIVVSNSDLKNREYIVQKVDNLGNIAKKFGITLTDLKQWNNLSVNTIVLGHNLIVGKEDGESNTRQLSINTFKKKENAAVALKQESSYFVQKGDSLYSIAKKYPGVTVSDIKKWNDISGEEIKPGMKLKIGG